MPRQPIRFEGRPLLDVAAYARTGPVRRDRLSPAEIELIARTVRRTPEVMVKVLTRGGQDLGAVRRHFEYLNRKGELEIDTDDGQRLGGKGVERELIDDWDLDIEEDRRSANLEARPGRHPPKLVYKVLFSMPPGTPPQKVLEAVKNFAKEEFGLKHRYAMVLHTDEPHPHVHMVIKAVSEQGKRLNIRKATLREWRRDFARHLRALGVPANATERAVRGETRMTKLDGIHRAMLRGQSTHMRARVQTVCGELAAGALKPDPGQRVLLRTRQAVLDGWRGLADILQRDEYPQLAAVVGRFAETMPSPLTEKEMIARQLGAHHRSHKVREQAPTR